MRKLVDIPEDVFVILSEKARNSGKNLKNYIEDLLAEDAKRPDEYRGHYKFTMVREPTDQELLSIMQDAARDAETRSRNAHRRLFDEINSAIRNAE